MQKKHHFSASLPTHANIPEKNAETGNIFRIIIARVVLHIPLVRKSPSPFPDKTGAAAKNGN